MLYTFASTCRDFVRQCNICCSINTVSMPCNQFQSNSIYVATLFVDCICFRRGVSKPKRNEKEKKKKKITKSSQNIYHKCIEQSD